jgi:hypothetical protein
MAWLQLRRILLLPCGIALLIGCALSIFGHTHSFKIVGTILIVIGMVGLRLSGPGTVRRRIYAARAEWSWSDRFEAAAYVAAALALVATFIAAADKIFDDRLTYTLLATITLATVFYICRRLLRL